MLTIRQVREVVAGLIHQMPEAPLPVVTDSEFYGGSPVLEALIEADLAASVVDIESWPSRWTGATLPHAKIRLMFAAECFRQMEEASPQEQVPAGVLPQLLEHAVIDQWPDHGKAWALATFGPGRTVE